MFTIHLDYLLITLLSLGGVSAGAYTPAEIKMYFDLF